jgi:enamine deaminase RidA (YjgF/YER057c/UK114 family)
VVRRHRGRQPQLGGGSSPPAATMVAVAQLIDPALKVEIQVDAVIAAP